MKKVILLIIIFLLIILSSVSAKAEYIDVEIRVVDLTDEPVSPAWVRIWNETGGEIVSCCGITEDDGIVNLRISGKEGPYVIQVFSFAGVDKPQSRGRELACESRYIFNSTAGSDAFYTIVVDEVNGSKGDTKTYEMAKNSLDISIESLWYSKWALFFAAISLFFAATSLIFTVSKWPKTKIWGNAENMLSKKADEIVKAVKETRTDDKIEDLLKKYRDKPEKEFIQKYAETEIAVRSLNVTSLAYFVALILFVIAILVSILINKYPDSFEKFFVFTIIGYITILIYLVYYAKKIVFEKEPLQKIIIAIEDDIKLKAHEQIESPILLNINEISNEVKSINSRIDILEKTVIEKADVILKEGMNLKKNEMPAGQGDIQDD